MKNDKMRIL